MNTYTFKLTSEQFALLLGLITKGYIETKNGDVVKEIRELIEQILKGEEE